MTSRSDLIELLAGEDHAGLCRVARHGRARVVRFLLGRLCAVDRSEANRAVRGLGALASDRELLSEERVVDLLRRLFWALNDESGAVPHGAPEAIGEILARRPEMQARYVGLLCGHLTHDDLAQTGPIERGVIWALGRVGPPVLRCRPELAEVLDRLAGNHPEEATRRLAAQTLVWIRDASRTPVDRAGDDPLPSDADGPPEEE